MKLFIIPVLFVIVIISGCTIPAYVTNAPQAPLFKKSNELNAKYVLSLAGTEGKLAYAFTDNIFVFGGAAFGSHDSIHNFKRQLLEGGIGFYSYMEEPFVIPFLIKINHFELLAGYGSGKSFGDFSGIIDSFTVTIPADYRRYFIQLNLGLSHSEEFRRFNIKVNNEFGHAIRLSFVDFYKFNYEGNIINKHLDNMFFEYLGFSRLGIGIVKFEVSAGWVIPFNKNSEFGGVFFFLGAGVNLNFSL